MNRCSMTNLLVALTGTTIAATALAQPANDFVADAIGITVPGTVVGTTVNSTNDFGLVGSCGNSASAAVLRDARERYDVPVVEVIQPAVHRAVRVTRSGRVAVIVVGVLGPGVELLAAQ